MKNDFTSLLLKNFLIIIVLIIPFNTNAQAPKWTHYTVASTSTQLCGNMVNAIAIDAEGNKWFGTDGGVSKLNGSTWTNYIETGNVNSTALDSQGNKWFGTRAGLWKFDGTTWTKYTRKNGLVCDSITSIAVDVQGNKWIGTVAGLSKFDGTTWTNYTTKNGLVNNYITCINVDPKGNKWIGTLGGVSKYNKTSWTNYTEPINLPSNYITCIASDPQGNVWIGTGKGIVIKFDGVNWISYSSADGLGTYNISFIAIDLQGNKWIGGWNGMSKFDDTHWTNYTTDFLLNRQVYSIAIDLQGNKWIGTSRGMTKFDGTNGVTYSPNGLITNNISSLSADNKGNKWFGSYDRLTKFDGSVWTNCLNTAVFSVANDNNDNAWINTGKYLYKIEDDKMYSYLKPANRDTFDNCPIALDKQGNKWLVALGNYFEAKLVKFDGINWIFYPIEKDSIYHLKRPIAIDTEDNKWIGSLYGVKKFDGANWINYTTKDGLVDNTVISISIDSQGNKWFGTYKGASKFDGSKWTNYTSANGLAGDRINDIACDAANNIWFCTSGGISKFNGTIWINLPLPTGVYSFTEMAIDNKGYKWFTSYNGVYKLDDGGTGPSNTFKTQTGAIFDDLNENGIRDAGEPLVSKQIIYVDTNYYTTTSNNGYFHTSFVNGNHTIEYKIKGNWHATTKTLFTVSVNSSSVLDTIFIGAALYNDASVDVTGGVARAGFNSNYWITYTNYGSEIETGKVVLFPDPRVEILKTTPEADTLTKDRIVWYFSHLKPLESNKIILETKMPGIAFLGDTLVSIAQITGNGTEINLFNNTAKLTQIVVGSYDPNDKLVTPEGKGETKAVLMNTPFIYTIRFQNTGTDTAFNINIRDTLNTNLDLSTLTIETSSHPVALELRPQNEAIFKFDHILLPDSNVNKPASNGFIKYSIKHKANLPGNTVITNKAYIYFDYNLPVATNEVKNTLALVIENPTGTNDISQRNSSVYPNPAKDYIIVKADKPIKIQVYTLQGKLLLDQTQEDEIVDISSLNPGLYLIHINGVNHKLVKL